MRTEFTIKAQEAFVSREEIEMLFGEDVFKRGIQITNQLSDRNQTVIARTSEDGEEITVIAEIGDGHSNFSDLRENKYGAKRLMRAVFRESHIEGEYWLEDPQFMGQDIGVMDNADEFIVNRLRQALHEDIDFKAEEKQFGSQIQAVIQDKNQYTSVFLGNDWARVTLGANEFEEPEFTISMLPVDPRTIDME